MSAHQAVFPIAAMARVLGVSKAGYYAWRRRPPSARAVADRVLMKRIRTIHVTSHETYGVPRVHAELRAGGQKHGRKRIARLMRAAGIVGVSRRRGTVATTRRDEDARPATDVIHHSDQGSQYTSLAFGGRCREAGVRPSMGSARVFWSDSSAVDIVDASCMSGIGVVAAPMHAIFARATMMVAGSIASALAAAR